MDENDGTHLRNTLARHPLIFSARSQYYLLDLPAAQANVLQQIGRIKKKNPQVVLARNDSILPV